MGSKNESSGVRGGEKDSADHHGGGSGHSPVLGVPGISELEPSAGAEPREA